MASSDVRDKLAKHLLKSLSAKENRETRKALQSTRPHVLFLQDLKFINETIKILKEKGHIPESVREADIGKKNLKAARELAKPFQTKYIEKNIRYKGGAKNIENTMGGIHLKRKFPHIYKQVKAGTAFMFRNFADIAECKKQIIKLVVNATEAQINQITKRVDRGHGAGVGFAVSGVTGAKALGKAEKALNPEDTKNLLKDMQDAAKDALEEGELTTPAFNDIIGLTISYNQIATTTSISATYIPFVTFQDKYTNRATDGVREKRVLKFIRGYFQERGADFLANLPGSSTLIEKAGAVAIAPLLEIEGSTIKVSSKIDPRRVKLKSKGKPSVKNAMITGGALKTKKGKAGKPGRGRVTKAKESTVSMGTLLGILNARINDRVAKNMGAPKLEYRTGRFASSVRITDVSKTPKGFPSVGYTYQTDPYSVFESTSGSRFASINRDPRSLIETSIRELAAELAVGRLYTRKV